MWNRVNLKKRDKNIPPVNARVIWATNERSSSETVFHKFIGRLTEDEKYVDYGYGRYKITSNYWWMLLPDDPEFK